jgi:hypothetical protein
MARLTTVLICDHAQVRENLLMVLSGGITRLHVTEFPAVVNFTVAAVIEVPYDEQDTAHEVRLHIVDPNTAEPKADPFILSIPPNPENATRVNLGEPIQTPLVVGIKLPVSVAGQYDVRVAVDDNPAEIQSLWVLAGKTTEG